MQIFTQVSTKYIGFAVCAEPPGGGFRLLGISWVYCAMYGILSYFSLAKYLCIIVCFMQFALYLTCLVSYFECAILQGGFFSWSARFSVPKWKKLAQPTRRFFTLKISWKTSPGRLQLVFHFGTENRADQLKKTTLYIVKSAILVFERFFWFLHEITLSAINIDNIRCLEPFLAL